MDPRRGDIRRSLVHLLPLRRIRHTTGASGTPRELGEETIDGSLARHYSTTLDLQKANDLAPKDIRTVLTADLAEMREMGVRTEVPADIWIDDSGLVRQTVFLFSFEDGTRVRVTMAYSEFGSPLQDIPDPAEVCQPLVANRTWEATDGPSPTQCAARVATDLVSR
jgi:hypothetical protein